MSNEYYDAGQVEQFEHAAYEAALREAGKEWEQLRGESDEREEALGARIDELEAENSQLKILLHDVLSQLEVATDLGNKRWNALNEIYVNGEKHNANWCKRKAQEGLMK